jgi:hypothetical protein
MDSNEIGSIRGLDTAHTTMLWTTIGKRTSKEASSPQCLAGASAFDRPPRDAQRSTIHCIQGIISRTRNGVLVSPIQDNSISAGEFH